MLQVGDNAPDFELPLHLRHDEDGEYREPASVRKI
jgi:peroxiredoxin